MSEEKDTVLPVPVAPIKKKPGRPRKKPIKEPIERKGVVSEPKNEENAIEFVYDEPVVYKRALAVFNAAHAKEITFIFEPDHIKMIGIDHLGKANILVTINCTRVPHYYCSERLVAPLNAKNVERVNQTIDKNCTLLNIIVKRTMIDPSIIMVFQNETLQMRENQTINIKSDAPGLFDPEHFECSSHTLSFELPNRAFKKLVTTATMILGRQSGRLTIQKVGAMGPLTFLYATADKNISSQCTADDAGVIKLTSTMDEDDIFISSVQLDYLKPYAGVLSETARIYADITKCLILAGSFDNDTVQVKVSISVVTSPLER